ncbi:TIGR03619 family F420-dependent LLM class oxidoreductase, partial [Marinitenerispora sediminis]
EELGYDAVWLPDHLLPPAEYGPVYGGAHEPLVTLAAVAAVTGRIRLGTSVLVLPLRDPFLVAKQTATLERLAPGRVVLGVGAGWEAAEFAALGADFTGRGARTDDALRLIRHLHTVGRGPFEETRYAFRTGVFAPIPTAPVPVMVGGVSDAALRRAARFGDIWQSVGLPPETFRTRLAALRAHTSRRIEAGARLSWPGARRAADVAAEARAFAAAGAGHVAVWFGPLDGFDDRMTAFARTAGLGG